MITGHTVTHRAREVSIVPSIGKWGIARMFQFSKHVRPSFPSVTAKVKMKSCEKYWSDILVLKDNSILIPHVKFVLTHEKIC